MTSFIDLPNPFESVAAPVDGETAAAVVPQPVAAAVISSSPEVVATNAPGMARSENSDPLEIPAFLRRKRAADTSSISKP